MQILTPSLNEAIHVFPVENHDLRRRVHIWAPDNQRKGLQNILVPKSKDQTTKL